jgi:hypothetical protein
MRKLAFFAVLFLVALLVMGAVVYFLPKISNPTGDYTVVGTLTYENESAVYVGINVESVSPSFSPNLIGSFMLLAFNGTLGSTFPTGFTPGNTVTVRGAINLYEHSQNYVLNVTSIKLQQSP